jgi:hypothetical protein
MTALDPKPTLAPALKRTVDLRWLAFDRRGHALRMDEHVIQASRSPINVKTARTDAVLTEAAFLSESFGASKPALASQSRQEQVSWAPEF